MRVLIVDDEAPIRRLLHRWVQAEGYSAIEASTAEQALEVMANMEVPPGVALCDIRLPGKDGVWLAEQLHARYPDTAIVMTTAVHDFDTAVTSLRAGVVDYVAKPFRREALTDALLRAVRHHGSAETMEATRHELEFRRAQLAEALALARPPER